MFQNGVVILSSLYADVGTPRLVVLPKSCRRGRDRTAKDMQRTLQKVWRNLESLCTDAPVVPIEDPSEHMQRRVVGVPRTWVILLHQVATLVVDHVRATAARGGYSEVGTSHAPKD